MCKISNKHVNTKVKNTKHLQSLNIEILRCKSNKTQTGLICWKLQNADERNKDLSKWRNIPHSRKARHSNDVSSPPGGM